MKPKSTMTFPMGFLVLLLTISVSRPAAAGHSESLSDLSDAPVERSAAPIIDPYEQGVQQWEELKAKQGAACSSDHEARQHLLGKKKVATVILLHGYSQSPKSMDDYFRFFSSLDVNVLVPRLSHHFNKNIADLESVKYADWLVQMRETVQIAKKLGRRIIIVGYSLGGSLATRMALEFPNDVTGLILLSPAWRINPRISQAVIIGNMTKQNGHNHFGYVPACDNKKPYVSAQGGKQVELLAASNEDNYDGAYPHADGTVIRKLEMPMLVAMMEDDDVVDSLMAHDMFSPHDNGYRTLLVFPGVDHSLLTTPSAPACQAYSEKLSRTPFKGRNLMYQVHEFIREILGVRTEDLKLGNDFVGSL